MVLDNHMDLCEEEDLTHRRLSYLVVDVDFKVVLQILKPEQGCRDCLISYK